MAALLSLFVLAGFTALVFGTGLRSRRRLELRSRLFAALAGAIRRDCPLSPMLSRLAAEERGRTRRALEEAARRLDEGHPLAEALSGGAAGMVPSPDLASIGAVRGTAELAGVLDQLGAETTRRLAVRHRIALGVVYPLLLLLLLLVTLDRIRILAPALPDLPRLPEVLPVLGAAILGLLVLRPWRWIPGGRDAARSRLYALTGAQIAAGVPLPEALQRAGAGCANRKVRAESERDAERLRAGVPPGEVLPFLPVPEGEFPDRLLAHAENLAAAGRARVDRRLSLIYPATVLLFSALVYLEFSLLMDLLARQREAVMPW